MDDDMVMVPVPKHLVTDVYRFIVEKEGKVRDMNAEQGGSGMKGMGEEQNGSGPQQSESWRYSHDWSLDDLRDALEEGTRAVKLILPYLAERYDHKVKGQELAEHVYGPGATLQQLGGALGSFTKTSWTRYGRHKWPFEAIRNDDERIWEYVMYEGTAKKVLKLVNA